ncbi:MAG: twin-arginine translocase TatA/TatE family subunit [Candidatus Cyclobacteriaceae bacterium M2_1C_046]
MQTLLLFSMPGGWEMVIIVLVILLLFGAKRIPELAKGLGRGIREFKDATKEIKNDIEKAGTTTTTSNPNEDKETK